MSRVIAEVHFQLIPPKIKKKKKRIHHIAQEYETLTHVINHPQENLPTNEKRNTHLHLVELRPDELGPRALVRPHHREGARVLWEEKQLSGQDAKTLRSDIAALHSGAMLHFAAKCSCMSLALT